MTTSQYMKTDLASILLVHGLNDQKTEIYLDFGIHNPQHLNTHNIQRCLCHNGGSWLTTLLHPLVDTVLGFLVLGGVGFNCYLLVRIFWPPSPPH